ncbi:MAG: hypothetical protein J7L55_05510 [Desulfurococcales archaeon]|nr:hypothetical protein [Desulfurococcales archaeon]
MKASTALGVGLILGGLVLIVASMLSPSLPPAAPQQPSEGGGFAGCVVIFFIPICFGSGTSPEALQFLSLAVFLVFLALTAFFIYVARKSFTEATYATP